MVKRGDTPSSILARLDAIIRLQKETLDVLKKIEKQIPGDL